MTIPLVVLFLTPVLSVALTFPIMALHHKPSLELSCQVIAKYRLGYVYLAAFLFATLTGWLNLYPIVHKEKLKLKGNIRANMQIFKVLSADDNGKVVVLEEEGPVGEYNRANRSLFHFIENMPSFLVCMFPAGFFMPEVTLCLTILYVTGRVLHQRGYVQGYGSHALGFGMAMLADILVRGIVLWGAYAKWFPACQPGYSP